MAEAEILERRRLPARGRCNRLDGRALVVAAHQVEPDGTAASPAIVAVARAELGDSPLLFALAPERPRGHIFDDDRPAHARPIADQAHQTISKLRNSCCDRTGPVGGCCQPW